jgi:hypothetical protein
MRSGDVLPIHHLPIWGTGIASPELGRAKLADKIEHVAVLRIDMSLTFSLLAGKEQGKKRRQHAEPMETFAFSGGAGKITGKMQRPNAQPQNKTPQLHSAAEAHEFT